MKKDIFLIGFFVFFPIIKINNKIDKIKEIMIKGIKNLGGNISIFTITNSEARYKIV